MPNDVRYGVKKWRIMGNDNKGILIVLEIALEPVNMLSIQVVGWLVQKQNIWLCEEQFSERNTGFLTSG